MASYQSVGELSSAVRSSIENGDLDRSLGLIRDFVERIITEPLCTSQVFGSKQLDELCCHIGNVSLKKNTNFFSEIGQAKSDEPVFVYVVTKLQKSGGHTRVIEDFIDVRRNGSHVILSTELDGKSDANFLNRIPVEKSSVSLEVAPNSDYSQRLAWLQKRLVELAPTKVYLFNNHQDSVAVAAVQPEMGLDAYFYHHGDHHLCLGIYLPHIKHIDPHPMGFDNCRNRLGIKNIYIPLVVEDKGPRSADFVFSRDGGLVTCTAARSNKIEIPYFVSYLDFVPKLLKVTGGKHVHIGRLTPWALLRIRRGLKKQGIALERFVYTPWVPSVWKALHDYSVDLYVSSFPYGGALTLIEAMGAGVPVALHRHIFSRILSCIDLAYPGSFNWQRPEELLDYCASVTAEDLAEAGKSARKQFEQFHRIDRLRDLLNASDENGLTPNMAAEGFNVAMDEWALWTERQLNSRHLIRRAIYRTMRKFRARWPIVG